MGNNNNEDKLPIWYQKVSEIPFNIFQKICIENDVSLLTIEGIVPYEILIETWEKIYYDYLDVIDSGLLNESGDAVEKTKLKLKYNAVSLCCDILEYVYDEEVVDLLRLYGFNHKFERGADNSKSVSRIRTSIKFWLLELKAYEDEIKAKAKSKGSNTKLDETFFAEALFAVSKHAGYHIKANEISALDFAIAYRDMVRYFEITTKKLK